MKACHLFFLLPLLLLTGCLEPMPFEHPGYPRNSNSNLRYPPNYRGPSQNQTAPRRYGERSPWERPPVSGDPEDPRYAGDPSRQGERYRPGAEPEPEPRPQPKPPKLEDQPLVPIDPIEEAEKPNYPYAIPVQDAPNLVVSPHSKDGPYIDVTGLSSGTQIECPKTGKTILVP